MADNWYVVLELEFDPPVEDENKIAERIEERSKFWSAHFNDFKLGAQYRSWHQNISQIKKDMLGPNNIRNQLATEACAIVYGPVDKLLKTIGRKGNITSDEGDKLSKKLNISLDVVKRRTKALGIQWVEEKPKDFQAIYDKYYKAKPEKTATYDNMKEMLSSFSTDNLYDFLYKDTTVKNADKLPYDTLRQRAEEKKKTEFYKSDSISGTGAKLCGQCEIVFKDVSSKQTYDKYLEYQKRRSILDDAKSVAEISGELASEQGDEIIGQLTQIFRDRKLAEDVLTAFCKIEKISYNARPSSAKPINLKICRCGCMNDVSDGRKVCSNCGLELIIKCPKCGSESDANIKVCKCGFQFENIDKAIALCEQAEYAIDSLDFSVAESHLSDAGRYWPNSNRISSLKQRLNEYKKRVGTEVTKMREAIKNKKYCEAERRYQSIQKLFSGYSDTAVENEINQALTKARNLFRQAKAAKVDKDILELCAKAYDVCTDLPGIKELMPPPVNVDGFKVTTNSTSRTNIISWAVTNDRSIRYVVVRSKNGWVRHMSDGEEVFRGSASSYADRDIEAGIPYYYNVFAERAGTYSKGASGDFKEIVNFFEVHKVTITTGDSTLKVAWDDLPGNASAEIYEVQMDGSENHIASSTANHYLIVNLVNDRQYRYRIALSYLVAGKKQETKGIIVSGMPTCPPMPIDTLRVKPLQEGQFEAVWVKSNTTDVRLYGSTDKPPYFVGDVVSISELEQKMTQLQQMNLSAQTKSTMKKDEEGAAFQYSGNILMYVVAVSVKAGSVVFGNLARVSVGENVTVKSVRNVNGKINIYIEPPQNATGFVVLHRFDQFPTDIGDINTVRKYIPIKQYQLNSAIVLDAAEEKKYYFTVFAEFRDDGEKDYSSGADYLFDNSAKTNITYSISVNKRFFGENSLALEFEADTREFVLPEIEIMSAVGNTPMFKASAKLFYTIPCQNVNGSVEIKIPIPKNMPKDTYIKAFFKDDLMQNRNQLKLKLKSNYKIS